MYRLRQIFRFLFPKNRRLHRTIRHITGYNPVRLHLYETAFRHKSIDQSSAENNERLEFLGDSVLNTIISEYLFMKYPFQDEGFMTQLRSKLVSRRQLNQIGKKLNLTEYLEVKSEGRDTPFAVYGNTFEALVGAIYLDHGYARTRRFIKNRILNDLMDIDEIEKTEYDFKSKLHQYAQKENVELDFRLVKEEKQNGKNFFSMEVKVPKVGKFDGKGYSKKSAEQSACEKACIQLKLLDS